MSDPKTIADAIRESIRSENLLGSGKEKAVFQFDASFSDLEGYVFSIQGLSEGEYWQSSDHILAKAPSMIGDASTLLAPMDHFMEGREFGQTLLETQNVTVMPRLAGLSLQHIVEELANEGSVIIGEQLFEGDDLYGTIAELPQAAYTQFMDDIRFAQEHGYAVDAYAGNFMVDPSQGRLTLIDIGTDKVNSRSGEDADKVYCDDIISEFILQGFLGGGPYAPDTPSEAAVKHGTTAFYKLLEAAETVGVPGPRGIKHPDLWEHEALSDLMDMLEIPEDAQEQVFERVAAIQQNAIPVTFKPKAIIETVAPVTLTSPLEELAPKLEETSFEVDVRLLESLGLTDKQELDDAAASFKKAEMSTSEDGVSAPPNHRSPDDGPPQPHKR